MAFDTAGMIAQKPKPLPIIMLLDVSGSMRIDGRIAQLDRAVQAMLDTLRKEKTQASEYKVSIVTFGGDGARILCQALSPSEVVWEHLDAAGSTPLGKALKLASGIVEDRELTPSRAYRPLVVLVCDGMPTDDWETAFEMFCSEGRTAKCDRMALSVGSDPRGMLEQFVQGTGHRVFEASEAGGISEFFKFTTMSVLSRTRSKNPNIVPEDGEIQAKFEEEIYSESRQKVSVRGLSSVAPSQSFRDEEDDSNPFL